MDTGKSTRCFIIFYLGVIIDHSSNIPDPVTLTYLKTEYNDGCLPFMAASHLRMLICEVEGINEATMGANTIYFESKSVIATGSSYKDTSQEVPLHQGKHF